MTFKTVYNEHNLKAYTDRVDVTLDISLHEYGIVRNPKTNRTIFCTNPSDDPFNKVPYEYLIDFIDMDTVIEALQEVEQGCFDFIGSDRQAEIDQLDNNYLTHHIMSLNQYCGYFDQY